MTMQFLLPGLSLAARIAAYIGAGIAGVAVLVLGPQVIPAGTGPLGIAILAAGGLFVSARHYRNKPVDLGFEDWRPASMSEFSRILSNLERTRKAALPVLYHAGCGISLFSLLMIAALITAAVELEIVSRFVVAAAALCYPMLLTGHVKLWTPDELKLKMDALKNVARAAESTRGDLRLVVTPYLRLDKDKEGREIPEDIRLLVEPRRKPEDFQGVQFQVAINRGPNGSVPYLYAVFLCTEKGPCFRRLSGLEARSFEVEPGADGEHAFVVLRQATTGGGYHTSPGDCTRLFGIVAKALEGLA